MGSDYVMDKDTDAKLFAAALYVISDMWGKEMGDMQRASLANQIVREIERRAILAAPPSPRSENVKCINCGGVDEDHIANYYCETFTPPPPSPRSDEGSGLTPSKHGFSAALRAQVIEECAKVAEERAASALALMNGAKRAGDLDDATQHLLVWTEAAAIASVIRSLSAVSAIAQERDVVKINDLIKNLDWYGKHYFNTVPEHRTLTYDRCMRLAEMCTEAADTIRHLTTSPSAISEAPTSADAVNADKIKCPSCFGLGGYGLSNDGGLAERCDTCEGFGTVAAMAVKTSPEVGEMVERLKNEVDGGVMDTSTSDAIFAAVSLLIALDAERGRLRTDVDRIISIIEGRLAQARSTADDLVAENAAQAHPTTSGQRMMATILDARAGEARSILEAISARSALPASDEKGGE